MSDDFFKGHSTKPAYILTGVLIGLAVIVISMLVFAAAIYFLNLDRTYSVPLSTVSLALGSLLAAYSVARKSESKGYLIGTIVGLISFALVTVISLIINKTGLTINTLFHFIIIVLSSAIGGIIGVNKGKNKKLI